MLLHGLNMFAVFVATFLHPAYAHSPWFNGKILVRRIKPFFNTLIIFHPYFASMAAVAIDVLFYKSAFLLHESKLSHFKLKGGNLRKLITIPCRWIEIIFWRWLRLFPTLIACWCFNVLLPLCGILSHKGPVFDLMMEWFSEPCISHAASFFTLTTNWVSLRKMASQSRQDSKCFFFSVYFLINF